MFPELEMPPAKVVTESIRMAGPSAEMLPELMMPPETVALLLIWMPSPFADVMVPALEMVPPTTALLMVMPSRVGGAFAAPVAEMVPVLVLVTSPVTVAVWMLMQLMAIELVTEACVPAVMLVSHAAHADGAPPPTSSAASDDDASNTRNRAELMPPTTSRAHPTVASRPFDQCPSKATTDVAATSSEEGAECHLDRGLCREFPLAVAQIPQMELAASTDTSAAGVSTAGALAQLACTSSAVDRPRTPSPHHA